MHPDVAGLGRRPDLTAELDALGDPTLTPARVLAQHRGRWLVAAADPAAATRPSPPNADDDLAAARLSQPTATGDPTGTPPAGPRLAPARGRLRDAGEQPVTGDWVALDGGGAIAAVLPRRGTIVRRAAGVATAAQVLAANVDLALVAEPLPAPNARRAERFAALAAAGGVPAALVLTKADLDPDAHLTAAGLGRRVGVLDALAVGAIEGDGLAPLHRLLEPGATAVLLGPSGAGKSTLVNALLGEARQETGAVRAADGRGRHTTVTRELVALPGGALLLDTPGLREVGLWDGGATGFGDVEALAAGCRFADCAHDGEPGCAVRGAVDPERLSAWRKLAREQAWVDDRRAATRERERLGRQRWQEQRAARRGKGQRW